MAAPAQALALNKDALHLPPACTHPAQGLLPQCGPPLRELLVSNFANKSALLGVARDWRLLDAAHLASPAGSGGSSSGGSSGGRVGSGGVSLDALLHFESHLSSFKEGLEAEMAQLVHGARGLTERPGWFENAGQAQLLNTCLDLSHW